MFPQPTKRMFDISFEAHVDFPACSGHPFLSQRKNIDTVKYHFSICPFKSQHIPP